MSLFWNRLASRALLDRPIHSLGVNYRAYMAEPTAPDTGSAAPARQPATQIFRRAVQVATRGRRPGERALGRPLKWMSPSPSGPSFTNKTQPRKNQQTPSPLRTSAGEGTPSRRVSGSGWLHGAIWAPEDPASKNRTTFGSPALHLI
jgi:hypothetical protein